MEDIRNEPPLAKAGILNYVFTQLLLSTKPQSYEDCNRLHGVLSCCDKEFYRRFTAVYEDKKISQNGDVFP